MQDILFNIWNWIFANWQLVIFILFGVVEFILLLIFRRDKVFDNSIYFRLLPLINEAESKFGAGHGAEKLNYVIDRFHVLYGSSLSFGPLKFFVEEILSTPHKKGGK